MIVCRTLGPIEVTVDGAMPPPDLLWKKHLALLIYLARSGTRGRTREHLTGLLWGDSEESSARHSLNEALRIIRRHAGDGAIETAAGQLRLAKGIVRFDADELEQHAERQEWRAAAELVAGEFLEGFSIPQATAFENWLSAERATWRERSIEVLVRHAGDLLRAGQATEAAEPARRALGLDPLSDRAACALMRALALAGDRAAALEQFGLFAARLRDEVGVEPGPETVELAERVRRQRLARPADASDARAASARLPLAGRETELRRLLDAAEASAAGRRAAVLIVDGENGGGKTRLVEEVLARRRLDGSAVSAARMVEADRADAGGGMRLLARGGLLEARGIAAAPSNAIATFARTLPEWAERFPVGPETAPLGHALREVVRAAADEQPVVLAVDDAQWLDEASTAALTSLLRDLAAEPVCLLLAVSPYVPRPDLDELRSRIGGDLAGTAVQVGPLPPAALHALAARLLPAYDAVELDRVVRRVGIDSAGLPLLAVELLRAVALGLDLRAVSGAWPEPLKTLDQSLPGDLPDAVVAAIRIGFRRLSADAQRVLSAASILGDRVPPARVAAALRAPLDQVHRALDELEWHHWLVAEPRGYGFVARLVRQVVERDMLTPGQRRRLLEAAGEVT